VGSFRLRLQDDNKKTAVILSVSPACRQAGKNPTHSNDC